MTTTPVRQEYEVQLEPLLSVPVERNLQAMLEFVRENGVRELWLALPITKERTIHRIVTARPDASRRLPQRGALARLSARNPGAGASGWVEQSALPDLPDQRRGGRG